jgi:shikimate dehydrogenase
MYAHIQHILTTYAVIQHIQQVVPYLDDIDDLARDINSVNTIVRSGTTLKGYNTDALGFRAAILKGMQASSIEIKTAVVYGYGGVTNCVVSVLKSLGIEVFITGRRPDAIQAKADQLNILPWCEQQKGSIDLFVNASPVTHHPLVEATNFLNAIEGCRIAFDHEMPGVCLEQHCTEESIYLIKGTEMYLPQMYAQWGLFLDGLMDDVATLPEVFSRIEESE